MKPVVSMILALTWLAIATSLIAAAPAPAQSDAGVEPIALFTVR